MSPFVRRRFIPEVESTGRAKRTLDVLVWVDSTTPVEMAAFHEIQVLREYLESIVPPVCQIILHLPEIHLGTAETLGRIGVPVSLVKTSNSSASVEAALKDEAPAERHRQECLCHIMGSVGVTPRKRKPARNALSC
jgi:hypothetical protein